MPAQTGAEYLRGPPCGGRHWPRRRQLFCAFFPGPSSSPGAVPLLLCPARPPPGVPPTMPLSEPLSPLSAHLQQSVVRPMVLLLLPCPAAFLLLLLCSLPSMTAAYFVLTRYSALSPPTPLVQSPEWSEEQQPNSLDQLAQELGDVDEWMRRPISSGSWEETGKQQQKRSAGTAKTLAGHEHVCKTVIRPDFRPTHGHEQNGTRVEIQQDERRQFSATFVECENTKREHCHGIDNAMFSSECVTVYEFRTAGVRLEGSDEEFVEGLVKVPITCQCRLRRKIGNGMLPNI